MGDKTVTWIAVDLSAPQAKLPDPLGHQLGGYFWVVCNGGPYGTRIGPSWWTGTEFTDWNNKLITHFAEMELPVFQEAPDEGD